MHVHTHWHVWTYVCKNVHAHLYLVRHFTSAHRTGRSDHLCMHDACHVCMPLTSTVSPFFNFIDPFPRTNILHPDRSWRSLSVVPRGPKSRPTKLKSGYLQFMYERVFFWGCASMHVWICGVFMCVVFSIWLCRVDMNTFARECACIRIWAHVYVYAYVYMRVQVCMNVCVYMYAWMADTVRKQYFVPSAWARLLNSPCMSFSVIATLLLCRENIVSLWVRGERCHYPSAEEGHLTFLLEHPPESTSCIYSRFPEVMRG